MLTVVTGATGFIGAEIVRRLAARGEAVRVLRRPASRLDLLGPHAGVVEHALGDVTDAQSVRAALKGAARVYHAAGFIGMDSRADRRRLYAVNVGGTANVVNAALDAGVERLVHTSSMAAFGRPEAPGGPLDETAAWNEAARDTAYARSKHLAEMEVQRGLAEGLDAVLVNPALVFGPGRRGENTALIVDRVRAGRFPAVPAGGTNVVDVRDVAEGHLLAMARGRTGERYFLGGENLTWEEILTTLAAAFGVAAPRRRIPLPVMLAGAAALEAWARLAGRSAVVTRESVRYAASRCVYDNRKAVAELGWRFRPFAETARDLAASAEAG